MTIIGSTVEVSRCCECPFFEERDDGVSCTHPAADAALTLSIAASATAPPACPLAKWPDGAVMIRCRQRTDPRCDAPPDLPRHRVKPGVVPATTIASGTAACEWTAPDGRMMISWVVGEVINTIAADGGPSSRDVWREVKP